MAQKLGHLPPFIAVCSQECVGQPAPVGQLNTCRAPAADQGEQGGAARRPAAGGVAPAGVENVERLRGYSRARSHCRFVLPLIHFIPYPLTYPVHLFLKRQCDRTLGALRRAPHAGSLRRRPRLRVGLRRLRPPRQQESRGQALAGLSSPTPHYPRHMTPHSHQI